MVVRSPLLHIIAILIVSFATPAHLGAETSPSRQSVEWLLDNPAHPEFTERLADAVSSVETVDDARALAAALPRMLLAPETLEQHALALAPILRTAREFAVALELYGQAYAASGERNLKTQLARAQLSLQLGRLALADRLARDVLERTDDYELKRRSYALVARALHAAGRHSEASRMVATLLALDDPRLVEPETLLLKERIERALGNEFSAHQTLSESHPESVAAQLFVDPQVRASALPIRFLEFADVTDGLEASEEVPSPVQPEGRTVAVTGIQVGSFRDPDNAHHMRRDIEALELSAEVRPQTREGQTIHTVVVTLSGGSSDVVRTMEILQTAGYDGFLIY